MVAVHTHPWGEGIRASHSTLSSPQDLMPPNNICRPAVPQHLEGHLSSPSTLGLRMSSEPQRLFYYIMRSHKPPYPISPKESDFVNFSHRCQALLPTWVAMWPGDWL